MLVSIPSRSGLLQNNADADMRTIKAVSIPSRSGLLQNNADADMRTIKAVSIPSRSGLLQNVGVDGFISGMLFQSLLVQVSFKTAARTTGLGASRFQSLLVQVSFKTGCGVDSGDVEAFQSLLVQVSFKTAAAGRNQSLPDVSIPSRSGLLQNRDG